MKCEYIIIQTQKPHLPTRRKCNCKASFHGSDGRVYCGVHANRRLKGRITAIPFEAVPKEKRIKKEKPFKEKKLFKKYLPKPVYTRCQGSSLRNKLWQDCTLNGKYVIEGIKEVYCRVHAEKYANGKKISNIGEHNEEKQIN
jgi:hypothetical protein